MRRWARSLCLGAAALVGAWTALGLPAWAGGEAASPTAAARGAGSGSASSSADRRGAESSRRLPSRMLVTASEWTYVLSRTKLRRGPAIIELYNRGEDPHNLRIRRADGKGRLGKIGKTDPGEGGRVELHLKRGKRYRLWCSLPTHRERGMKATLKVRRKR